MKKLAFLSGLTLLTGSLAFAGELQDNVGVGLGSLIFDGQKGLVQQVLAATTNGSCGNQTFAVTSGTLGAKQPDSIVQNETLRRFVAGNMDNLARDIAAGRGETLDTLADLMAVPEVRRGSFNNTLRTNFRKIYPTSAVTHLDVLQNLAAINA